MSSPNAELPKVAEILAPLLQRVALHEQPLLSALAERLGAATWRAFARHEEDAARRAVLLACAELEEASALVLEQSGH